MKEQRAKRMDGYRYSPTIRVRAGFLFSVPALCLWSSRSLIGAGKQSANDIVSSFLTSSTGGEVVPVARKPRSIASGLTVTNQEDRPFCIGHSLAAAIGEAENMIGRNFDFKTLQAPLAEAIGCNLGGKVVWEVLNAFLEANGGQQSREKIYEVAADILDKSVDEAIEYNMSTAIGRSILVEQSLKNMKRTADEFFRRDSRLPLVYTHSVYTSPPCPKNRNTPRASFLVPKQPVSCSPPGEDGLEAVRSRPRQGADVRAIFGQGTEEQDEPSGGGRASTSDVFALLGP